MPKRLLVNIRGCNGAGKSTVPMSMMDDPDMFVQELLYSDGKRMSAMTVFPTYGWVALGTYFNKTGGMDTLKNNDITKRTLCAALDLYPEYDVLMEGIMASTIRSTYVELFHEVEDVYANIQVIVMSFLPPVEIAIERVYKRNGGKPIQEDAVRGKWMSVERSHKAFKEDGFTAIRCDTSRINKNRMLSAFLHTVEKYRSN